MDSTDIQNLGQVGSRLIDTTTIHVTSQKHGVKHVGLNEQIRSARASVLNASLHDCSDNSFCIDELVAEVSSSISTLKLGLHAIDINKGLNGVQIIILPDGTDMILGDLIGAQIFAAVANKSSQSDLFLKRILHNIALIVNNVEIGNIDNIVTMQGIAIVDGLRIGSTHQDLEITRDGLLGLTFGIALRTDILSTCIDLASTDARNGALTCLLHNGADPRMVALNKLGSARLGVLIIGEQTTDLARLKAMSQSILVVVNKSSHSRLQSHTRALGHFNDLSLIGMSQNINILLIVLFKNISVHNFIASFRVFHIFIFVFFFVLHFVLGIFKCLTNEGVNNSLLLFGKSIEDILNCFFLRSFLRFFFHLFLRSSVFDLLFVFIKFISHFVHILLLGFGMLQGFIFFSIVMNHNILIIANNKALFGVFTVNHNRINECPGISTGHHNTYFSNNTMQNFITGLFKFISINRQGFNITMPNCFFCCLPRFAIIEGAICVHTFITIL